MSLQRNASETFLHFMADNLTGITVHPVRRDLNSPSGDLLQTNAVNIQFLSLNPDVWISTQHCSIDVLNDDENTCVDWVQAVWNILAAAFGTAMFDYSVPTAPVPTNTNVFWEKRRVNFKRIISEQYTHYSCLLPLKFHSTT